MPVAPQNWVQDFREALAVAPLLGGIVLLPRLLWNWSRSAPQHNVSAAVARLRSRSWQPLDAAVLLLALLLPITPALLAAVRQPVIETAGPSPTAIQFVPYLVYYLMVLAGVLLAARRTGLRMGEALGITRHALWPSLRAGVALGLGALPLLLLASWLTDLMLRGMGCPVVRQPVFDVLADAGMDATARALLLAVAVLVAPVAEEAVFRGVVFPCMLRGRRLFHTLLLVNVLFALLHLNVAAFLPLLAVGLCFSGGMLATGNVLTPIVMHAIFNGEMLLIFFAWPHLSP